MGTRGGFGREFAQDIEQKKAAEVSLDNISDEFCLIQQECYIYL